MSYDNAKLHDALIPTEQLLTRYFVRKSHNGITWTVVHRDSGAEVAYKATERLAMQWALELERNPGTGECVNLVRVVDAWLADMLNAPADRPAKAGMVRRDVGPTFSAGKYRGYVCDVCGEEFPHETSRDVHFRRAQRGLGCQRQH